ncbi:hypothetical protein OS493_025007 [Desmophyllum pertusum]|uniref:Uncharacterized protein n=1 Tax=Desmophyllum pertusum TaxID=174260 RepID=A0A9W9YLL4_9CNID|nr:hypothetical protein OS493_025007 [Desmophyllum pertusum]
MDASIWPFCTCLVDHAQEVLHQTSGVIHQELYSGQELSGTTGSTKCAGKYGRMGIASIKNHPGCRVGASSWIDRDGQSVDVWWLRVSCPTSGCIMLQATSGRGSEV